MKKDTTFARKGSLIEPSNLDHNPVQETINPEQSYQTNVVFPVGDEPNHIRSQLLEKNERHPEGEENAVHSQDTDVGDVRECAKDFEVPVRQKNESRGCLGVHRKQIFG